MEVTVVGEAWFTVHNICLLRTYETEMNTAPSAIDCERVEKLIRSKFQLKFIKTGSSKAEHTHNNLYRYSKIYVNIEYNTIKYSRITNTKNTKK